MKSLATPLLHAAHPSVDDLVEDRVSLDKIDSVESFGHYTEPLTDSSDDNLDVLKFISDPDLSDPDIEKAVTDIAKS